MSQVWMPLLPFLAVALIFAWMTFFGGRPKSCPDCNEPLPRIQSPFTKTKRQWWEGGYVCQNCGCEADMKGRKILPGTVPQGKALITSLGFLMLVALPGIVLLTALLRR